MKRILLAMGLGAAAGAAVAAWPLLRQQSRWSHAVAASASVAGESAAVRTITGDPVLQAWRTARESGSKADAELRAYETIASLTAAQCRTAAETALRAGDKAPLPDLLTRWASLNGREAFDWLAGHPDILKLVIQDAGPAWAAADPAGYAAWLPGWREEGESLPVWRFYPASHWLAPWDLPAAMAVTMGKIKAAGFDQLHLGALELEPFIRTPEDARGLAAMMEKHPEWLADVPEEKPLYLLVALRQCWQDLDPAGWDRWAEAHPDLAARAENEPVRPALTFVRSQDPAAEASRILDAAPPEERGVVLDGLMHLWSESDLNAAGSWLAAVPDAPDKWQAVETFALAAVRDDPPAALKWAGSISDPLTQTRAQRRVFTAWATSDPAAASAWLPGSGWDAGRQQAAHDILSTVR